jgi:hypothetical protein
LDKDTVRNLIAAIERELSHLEELRKEMGQIVAEQSPISRRAKGSILHDFYNGCERIFKAIASEVNGGHEESDQWHKSLLVRMTNPIPEVRPRVLSDALAAELDDYLAFRHLFRNIYGFELKGERLRFLTGRFDLVAAWAIREIRQFREFLEKAL